MKHSQISTPQHPTVLSSAKQLQSLYSWLNVDSRSSCTIKDWPGRWSTARVRSTVRPTPRCRKLPISPRSIWYFAPYQEDHLAIKHPPRSQVNLLLLQNAETHARALHHPFLQQRNRSQKGGLIKQKEVVVEKNRTGSWQAEPLQGDWTGHHCPGRKIKKDQQQNQVHHRPIQPQTRRKDQEKIRTALK